MINFCLYPATAVLWTSSTLTGYTNAHTHWDCKSGAESEEQRPSQLTHCWPASPTPISEPYPSLPRARMLRFLYAHHDRT